ncbi:MAG TPA: hypothetical protein VGB55_08130 [Tepidisphaeraceae bacterium]
MSRITEEASNVIQKIGQTSSNVASQIGQRGSNMASAVGSTPLTNTTARIPADAFLLAALGSIGASLILKLAGRDRDAEFVGHWAPTLVTFSLLSKLLDHDRKTNSVSGGGEGI